MVGGWERSLYPILLQTHGRTIAPGEEEEEEEEETNSRCATTFLYFIAFTLSFYCFALNITCPFFVIPSIILSLFFFIGLRFVTSLFPSGFDSLKHPS
jgi:uncharacterized protein YqhQ